MNFIIARYHLQQIKISVDNFLNNKPQFEESIFISIR